MKKNKLFNIINNIYHNNKIVYEDLDQISKKYPFFSTIYLMKIILSKDISNEKFHENLIANSIKINDRKVLYDSIAKLNSPQRNFLLNTNKKIGVKQNKQTFLRWLDTSEVINQENNKIDFSKKTDFILNYINSSKEAKKNKFENRNKFKNRIEIYDLKNYSVTQTLAEIYKNQGYYDKAIIAYEILSLKYPQKSSLFANEIKLIKKLNK